SGNDGNECHLPGRFPQSLKESPSAGADAGGELPTCFAPASFYFRRMSELSKVWAAGGLPPGKPGDGFVHRHIGPSAAETARMLQEQGFVSLEAFIDAVVPPGIRLKKPLQLPASLDEPAALAELRAIAAKNQVFRSFIGMGYSDCLTPPVLQR